MTEDPEKKLSLLQRRHFEILDELWRAWTGIDASSLPLAAFDDWVPKNARSTAKRMSQEHLTDELLDFYEQIRHEDVFDSGRRLGGQKLVLSGGTRLTESHLSSIRKMVLYADTIFVPDPVLPWIESPREEEAFSRVWLLKSIHHLLSLKPLIVMDLPYPPIVVFPSWEKSLEAHDNTTREGQKSLITAVVASELGRPFDGYNELLSFARDHSEEFLRLVDEKRLFIGPGDGKVGDPLETSMRHYREEIETWRAEEFKKMYGSLSDGELAFMGLAERLAPQYHVLENAEELVAGPMFALDIHWHYYRMTASLFETRLRKLALLDETATAEVRALENPTFEWLGDLPVEILAELRSDGENERFRNALRGFTSELHEAALEDVNRVVSEVSRGIASLIIEHRKEIKAIQEKYKPKKFHNAIVAGVTGAALMFPTLAPLAPVSGLTLLAKFAWDAISEELDRSNASRSLMGVLAQSREKA